MLKAHECSFYMLVLTSDVSSTFSGKHDSLLKLKQALMKMSDKVGVQDLAKLCYSTDVTQSTENHLEYNCDYFSEFYSSQSDKLS